MEFGICFLFHPKRLNSDETDVRFVLFRIRETLFVRKNGNPIHFTLSTSSLSSPTHRTSSLVPCYDSAVCLSVTNCKRYSLQNRIVSAGCPAAANLPRQSSVPAIAGAKFRNGQLISNSTSYMKKYWKTLAHFPLFFEKYVSRKILHVGGGGGILLKKNYTSIVSGFAVEIFVLPG
jgi:hypothetical protein